MAESTKLNFSEGLKYYDEKLKNYIAFSIEQNGGIQRTGSTNEELGANAMALGSGSHAKGIGSVSIGYGTHSIGLSSFTEGNNTIAEGHNSHAEGGNTLAKGTCSHAEGGGTEANGDWSHVGGAGSIADGDLSFAHGWYVNTIGDYSVALGRDTIAGMKAYYYTAIDPTASEVDGYDGCIYLSDITTLTELTDARKPSYGQGTGTTLSDFTAPAWNANDWLGIMNTSHFVFRVKVVKIENNKVFYKGNLGFTKIPLYSDDDWDTSEDSYTVYNLSQPEKGAFVMTHSAVASGNGAKAIGSYGFATGRSTIAYNYGVAEGHTTTAGYAGHAEGKFTLALGDEGSHAEGRSTEARGNRGHAEGSFTQAFGFGSHAEGRSSYDDAYQSYNTIIYNPNLTVSDVETKWKASATTDKQLIAFGDASHAEGRGTAALGANSHAEGFATLARGDNAHAEGDEAYAIGAASHAEGRDTQAIGNYSHAGGYAAKAHHEGAFVIGNTVTSGKEYQTVLGRFNKVDNNAIFVIGGGNTSADNALTVQENGTLTIGGVSITPDQLTQLLNLLNTTNVSTSSTTF